MVYYLPHYSRLIVLALQQYACNTHAKTTFDSIAIRFFHKKDSDLLRSCLVACLKQARIDRIKF